jgi:hypothetical protein
MFSNGNSFCLGEATVCLTGIRFEGAIATGPGLHLFDAGPESMIQKLGNAL